MGNLNYNKLLIVNTKDVYIDCSKKIITTGKGGGYWLAFGCEIPRDMPPEHIEAMLRATKTIGKYPIQD